MLTPDVGVSVMKPVDGTDNDPEVFCRFVCGMPIINEVPSAVIASPAVNVRGVLLCVQLVPPSSEIYTDPLMDPINTLPF